MKRLFRRNKKIGMIALLLFMVLGSATGAYAYWAASVTTPIVTENEKVTVGEAVDATAIINVSLDQSVGTLVPAGQITNSVAGALESITLTYDVTWTTNTGEPAGTLGTLVATVGNIQGDTNNLLNFDDTATYAIVVDGSAVTVAITITMSEPANQTEYAAIVNANITFDVTFTATPTQ